MSELGEGVNVDGGNVDNGGNGGADNNSGTDDLGSGINSGQAINDDLSGLFTPDEIQAKRDAAATAKAEEERRSKLTDEERAAEDKAKSDEEANNKVPDEYADFTVPEGVTLDPDLIADFKPIAKELGLSQVNAQKLVDLQLAIETKRQAKEAEVVKSWADQAAKDQEIGGAKIKENLDIANQTFDKLATPELKQLIQASGINNHPEFIRMWVRIGKQVVEDSMHMSGGRTGEAEGPRIFKYENTK